jgi:hypothetical protein
VIVGFRPSEDRVLDRVHPAIEPIVTLGFFVTCGLSDCPLMLTDGKANSDEVKGERDCDQRAKTTILEHTTPPEDRSSPHD